MRSVWEILAIILTVTTLGAILSLPVTLPLLDDYFTPEKHEPNTVLVRAYVGQHGGFEPKIIKLKKGEKVRIVVEAMDLTQGFAVDELGIDIKPIVPGDLQESKLVYYMGTLKPPVNSTEIVVNKTGVFKFINSNPAGEMTPFQIGYIIVEGEE